MEKDHVWLGPMRRPVRAMAIAASTVMGLLFVYLIIQRFTAETPMTMFDMIRPEGRIIVWAMLLSLASSILLWAIYLSDNIGAIEPEPHGFFDFLSLITSRIAMIGIVAVVLVMFYEVVSRYVFSAPTLWANELSLWMAAFIFLFAGQYAMQQRSHIRIYVVYDLMPRWMQKTADVISVLLILGFTFALVWGGFTEAWTRMLRMEKFGTAWNSPLPGTLKPAILIIIVLVAIQAVSNLIADWNKAPEQHSPSDEIDEIEIENIRRAIEEKD